MLTEQEKKIINEAIDETLQKNENVVVCPYCKEEASWVDNSAIYGRNYGKSYKCYYCKPCDAYVGCHQNTRRPLGTMANRELREWRKKTHAMIDPIWKVGMISRYRLYEKLSQLMDRDFHVGESDMETCKRVMALPWVVSKNKEALERLI